MLMDNYTSQKTKSQRRKRKDPQSRDFACRCAAYTHVKNKHDGQKDYFDEIARPERTKLKRGRPKEKKHYQVTIQNEKLSIIQEAILEIYQSFRRETDEEYLPKIILQGNQQFSVQIYQENYNNLVKTYGDPGLSFSSTTNQGSNKFLVDFIRILNQHFVPEVAAKITYYLNVVMRTSSNIDKAKEHHQLQINFTEIYEKINIQSKIKEIWDGNTEVAGLIIKALEKCTDTDEKSDHSFEENYLAQ